MNPLRKRMTLQQNNYHNILQFIKREFAPQEVLNEAIVWEKYWRKTKDKMNGEFPVWFEQAIQELLREGYIKEFSSMPGEYIVVNRNKEQEVQEEKDR